MNSTEQANDQQCKCKVIDDEQHCLNYCTRFRSTNLCDKYEKHNFDNVYATDLAIVKNTIKLHCTGVEFENSMVQTD